MRTILAYVTDLEGHLDYWNNYINKSHILKRINNLDPTYALDNYGNLDFVDSNSLLVYGGDVCDRGAADIRILYDLLSLRDKYPNRVHFILGNRDVNKMRLPFTLHESALNEGAYWVPPIPTSFDDPVAKLQWTLQKTMGGPQTFEFRREELKFLRQPAAFVASSLEGGYSKEGEPIESPVTVSDEEVMKSFLDLVRPLKESMGSPYEGLLLRYLQAGKLAIILGDILIVHGAIKDSNYGKVPPYSDRQAAAGMGRTEWSFFENAAEWVEAINEWAAAQVEDYVTNMDSYLDELSAGSARIWDPVGGYGHPQPGSGLVQYGMGTLPDKSDTFSVVYNSFLDGGKPAPHSREVAEWLLGSGLRRVVVGHQPQGDAPLIQERFGVQTVSVDTSYAYSVQWKVKQLKELFCSNEGDEEIAEDTFGAFSQLSWLSESRRLARESQPGDSRGAGPHVETLFFLPSDERTGEVIRGAPSSGLIYGQLSQTSPFAFQLLPVGEDKFIGKTTRDGWVVKARGVRPPSGSWEGIWGRSWRGIMADTAISSEKAHPDRYYLLHWSEGFNFRQRLVKEVDIEREF